MTSKAFADSLRGNHSTSAELSTIVESIQEPGGGRYVLCATERFNPDNAFKPNWTYEKPDPFARSKQLADAVRRADERLVHKADCELIAKEIVNKVTTDKITSAHTITEATEGATIPHWIMETVSDDVFYTRAR